MGNIRPFQIVLLAIFAIVGVISIFVLSAYRGITGETAKTYGDSVEIWGTLNSEVFEDRFFEIVDDDDDFRVVQYLEMDPRTFEGDLVNAIAEGYSPDIVILNHEDLVTYRSKLLAIPYDTIPLRVFKDTYLDGAEIFALYDGIYAIPFLVDPLVMYWNRDMFAKVGRPLPPATWEELTELVPQITRRDNSRNILESAIAFGEYRNVINAKGALLTLLMQSGSRLIEEEEDEYTVAINRSIVDGGRDPLSATLQFFVEFSNANSPLYSWNRSRQSDRLAFVGEELALYFGYGSENTHLRELNPNFNYDVTEVPQGAGTSVHRVYGQFYGFAILKASDNPQGAFQAINRLVNPETALQFSEGLGMVPLQRNLVALGSANPYHQVLYRASLIARGWLDPNYQASNTIFQTMVEDIVSNRMKISNAAVDTVSRLRSVF